MSHKALIRAVNPLLLATLVVLSDRGGDFAPSVFLWDYLVDEPRGLVRCRTHKRATLLLITLCILTIDYRVFSLLA